MDIDLALLRTQEQFNQALARLGVRHTEIPDAAHVVSLVQNGPGNQQALMLNSVAEGFCLLMKRRRLVLANQNPYLRRLIVAVCQWREVGHFLIGDRNLVSQERRLQWLEFIKPAEQQRRTDARWDLRVIEQKRRKMRSGGVAAHGKSHRI